MKKNDIFLILIILLASAGLFAVYSGARTDAETVEIYKNNKIYCKIPLGEDNTIDIDERNCVVVKNGEVYMESADCPDQICVKQQPLSKSGRDIICLPNGVLVRVTGKTAVDAEAG